MCVSASAGPPSWAKRFPTLRRRNGRGSLAKLQKHGLTQRTSGRPLSVTMAIAHEIHPDKGAEEALSVLDDEIKRVQDEVISEDEVRRAIKQARALFAYGSENISNQAFWMGYSEMFADYSWFESYLDNLAAVTPASVQRVAQEYLRPQSRVVGTYFPKVNGENEHA